MNVVKIIRGDTWRRKWELRKANGQPIELEGASARLHVRTRSGDLVLAASVSNGMILIDTDNGAIELRAPPNATASLLGEYFFDLEVTMPDGDIWTIEQATLEVLRDWTHD